MKRRHRGRAWIKQLARQVRDVGAKLAPWYTVWDEPDGTRRMKSAGPGSKGKKDAQALADKINSQITLGEYESDKGTLTTWKEFTAEYFAKGFRQNTRAVSIVEARVALKHFSRILKLDEKPVGSITTRSIDEFVAVRSKERGRKPGSTVSAATINKDLRHIKAALRKGHRWKYVKELPEINFAVEERRHDRYITREHFALIFQHCDKATLPNEGHFSAGDWWKALLTFAYLTGWRIGEILSLEWRDVDLETGLATTRAETNKGRRDSVIRLQPELVNMLRPLKSFHPNVFPWELSQKTLDDHFDVIQIAAGIHLDCNIPQKHVHTPSCHLYGFHDSRRAFATENRDLPMETLQALMRHASYQTTQGYIKRAKDSLPALPNVYVPSVLKVASGGNRVG